MPEHLDPPARDYIRQLRDDQRRLEARVAALEAGRGGVSLNRGDPTTMPNPREGMVMVDTTNVPYHYAEGEWRPFGGTVPLPWFRRSFTTDKVIAAADVDTLLNTWDTEDGSTDSATYFDTTSSSNIKIILPGVYVITAEIVMASSTVDDVTIILSNLDYDWNTRFFSGQVNGSTIEGTATIPGFVHRFTANTFLQLYMTQFSAGNWTAQEGYWEIVRLGEYTGPDPEDSTPAQ